MDLEQILKHVEWLDDERRKDKDTLTRQNDRLLALEGNITATNQQLKDISSSITRLGTLLARVDHFDEALLQSRIEFNRQLEEIESLGNKRDEEREKTRRIELRTVDSSLAEMRKELEVLGGMKKVLQGRGDEDLRLARLIDDIRFKVQELSHTEEEHHRNYKLLEEGHRQDAKRLVDVQGELSSLRKKTDEQRAQTELFATGMKKIETRLSELMSVDVERRIEVDSFLEKQALVQVERDRTWKEWLSRLEIIEKQAIDVESQLAALDASQRTIRTAKESLDELGQRVERRVSELIEMQRLAEERLRQEWTTFKADDQKRWTNYTLVLEEQRGELNRIFQKALERISHLEENFHELQDFTRQINDQTGKQLHDLLALIHDWAETYERLFSHGHK